MPFEIDETIDPSGVTARAGVSLVIELFRQLGVVQAMDEHIREFGLPLVNWGILREFRGTSS